MKRLSRLAAGAAASVLSFGAAQASQYRDAPTPVGITVSQPGTAGKVIESCILAAAQAQRLPPAMLVTRRTLVPCDAFYEWKAMADGKQPYAIALRDGAQLAFAGIGRVGAPLMERRSGPSRTTTAANGTMSVLHGWMPVMLEAADWPYGLGRWKGTARRCFVRRPTTCSGYGR